MSSTPTLTAPPPHADEYARLRAALEILDQQPTDEGARLISVRQYASLGLFGPALEQLADQQRLLETHETLRQSLATLRAQPNGLVNWAELRAQFDANFAALQTRQPAFPWSRAELLEALKGIDLFRCRDGQYQLSRRVGRGPRRWLPQIVDWRSIINRPEILPQDTRIICVPYAVEGVGLGDLIALLYDRTRMLLNGYRPRIHLFERNPVQLAAWLHVCDGREIIADERVWLWAGPAGVERFMAFHEAHPEVVPPPFVVGQPGFGAAATSVVPAAVQELQRRGAARFEAQAARARYVTQGHDFAYYAQRFAGRHTQPLRILGITSRFTTFLQYAMRDIQQTLAQRGHEFRLCIEPDDLTPAVQNDAKAAQIADFNPDLMLIIDHNRPEFGKAWDFPVPFVNWIQDDLPHLFAPGAGRVGPYDLTVGYITPRTARPPGYPERQIRYLSVPVNPRVYDAAPAAAELLTGARCEASFVSHLSEPVEIFVQRATANEQRPTRRLLLRALFEEMRARITAGNVPPTTLQTTGITQQVAHEIGIALTEAEAENLRRDYTDRMINLIFRHQPLEWAAEMGLDLHLYGKGWERHPRLGRFARGPASNGEHLRAIFQASTINLQIYPISDFHQRLLEGLCSGGFFLIRGTPRDDVAGRIGALAKHVTAAGIQGEDALWNVSDPTLRREVHQINEALFAPRRLHPGYIDQLRDYAAWSHVHDMPASLPGYAAVAFRTRTDFERQVKKWLGDADARQEVAARQREFVLTHFTYDAVLEQILEFAAKYFTTGAASQATSRFIPTT